VPSECKSNDVSGIITTTDKEVESVDDEACDNYNCCVSADSCSTTTFDSGYSSRLGTGCTVSWAEGEDEDGDEGVVGSLGDITRTCELRINAELNTVQRLAAELQPVPGAGIRTRACSARDCQQLTRSSRAKYCVRHRNWRPSRARPPEGNGYCVTGDRRRIFRRGLCRRCFNSARSATRGEPNEGGKSDCAQNIPVSVQVSVPQVVHASSWIASG